MKKRVIYDDNGQIITIQQWVDETKMPVLGNITYQDIDETENEITEIKGIDETTKKVKVVKKQKPKSYNELKAEVETLKLEKTVSKTLE